VFHPTVKSTPVASSTLGVTPDACSVASTSQTEASSSTTLVTARESASSKGSQWASHDTPDRYENGSYRQVHCSSDSGTPRKYCTSAMYCCSSTTTRSTTRPDSVVYVPICSRHSGLTCRSVLSGARSIGSPVQS